MCGYEGRRERGGKKEREGEEKGKKEGRRGEGREREGWNRALLHALESVPSITLHESFHTEGTIATGGWATPEPPLVEMEITRVFHA